MPPGLIVGEAQDLGPQLVKVGSLLLVKDGSVDTVFHRRAEHIPVEEPHEGAQATEQVEFESVDSSEAETKDPSDKMVVHQNMTADWFLLGGRPIMQQQAPPPPTLRG